MIKLHLGCGPHIKEGWQNCDLEPGPGGVKCDLRAPFSWRHQTVDFIFTEHFIEHLNRAQAFVFLKECYRCLKPGGVIRISTPDLTTLVEDYLANYTKRYEGVWEPATPCQMLNEGMRLWGHQFLFDSGEMERVLREVGFSNENISFQEWRKSGFNELCDLEVRPFHNDIIVEATK